MYIVYLAQLQFRDPSLIQISRLNSDLNRLTMNKVINLNAVDVALALEIKRDFLMIQIPNSAK